MVDDPGPGRPPVESVFVAFIGTTIAGAVLALVLARILPPVADAPAPGVPLTITVVWIALAFAVAQAVLPGSKSVGCAGLLIPMLGAAALASRGHEPAIVVAALFTGVFLTPAAYYVAVRLSITLRGFARRRPFAALLAGAGGMLVLLLWLRTAIDLAGSLRMP